ncbi:M20/M25/M40 family metallo-hydrolase [Microbispora siamensis]|uniref:Acetylornithine deacetylase n=1 Tax=Microbispora siamensis TaxID=564413 RepID=A0ABQ4GRQ4_9ACTN|nr:M20/M25/M40 family metallo-hydrolase [Microbispora siamensis]GIH64118.1 acetylornithine deacetylase [Microbispora siamensis]
MSTAIRRDVEGDARSWIAAFRTEIRDSLADAIALPSLPCSIEQNDVQDIVQQIADTGDGIVVDRWTPDWEAVEALRAPVDDQLLWVPLVERDPRYAEVLPELACVAFTHGRPSGPSLVLNGHVDVVPADGQAWTTRPFEASVRDGWMYGRGAMDMKAGLIAAAFAFRYIATHWDGPGSVRLCSVVEEESGGNGTLACMHRGHVGDSVVFAEPTDLRVVHRHVGIQSFQVQLGGRAGGMLRRSWGTSVFPSMGRVLTALAELELERTARAHALGGYDADDLPGFVNVGFASGGEWLATRAEHATLRGLMGILPGETQEEATREITERVRAAVGDADDISVEVVIPPGGHRGGEIGADSELVRAFRWSAESGAVGGPSRAGTMVCDAKIVHGGGWAPAIVLGPHGEGLHSADERVELASVEECAVQLIAGSLAWLDQARLSN